MASYQVQRFRNNYSTTLGAPFGSADTSLTLATGHGWIGPGTNRYYTVTIEESGVIEVIHAFTLSGDVLTSIARAREGTSNQTFSVAANVFLSMTYGGLEEIQRGIRPINIYAFSQTIQSADFGTLLQMTSGSAMTLTCPNNTTLNYPTSGGSLGVGGQIQIMQWGTGIVTFAAGAGATLASSGGLSSTTQYKIMTLTYMDASTWLLDV